MNNDEIKATEDVVVEETVETDDAIELDFWDKVAINGRKFSKGAKKVGKVLLIGGGIAVLGGIGLAVAKSIRESNSENSIEDKSWDPDNQVDNIIDDSDYTYVGSSDDVVVETSTTVE